MPDVPSRRADARSAIVEVAAGLLQQDGPTGVTTRRVAERAGVQAPAIYRLFGDKDGLLEAVAEHVLASYVAAKSELDVAAAAADLDPLDELRSGWRMQVEFALANPAVFRMLTDPERSRHSPAAEAGRRVLASRVHRVAATGRLRVAEQRAVDLIQAAGTGVIQTLLAAAPEARDPGLADAMYEAVLRQVLTEAPAVVDAGPVATAVAFRAIAPGLDALSDGERRLLTEWLDRAIAAG